LLHLLKLSSALATKLFHLDLAKILQYSAMIPRRFGRYFDRKNLMRFDATHANQTSE
jgi:hypothetical protein